MSAHANPYSAQVEALTADSARAHRPQHSFPYDELADALPLMATDGKYPRLSVLLGGAK